MARRSLPIAPPGPPAVRGRALTHHARPVDAVRPRYAVWEITLQCDLACRHCGSRAGRKRPDELTTDEALEMVAQLAELGIEECTIIGGEAYLRDDWTTIARALVDAGIDTSMTTGGRGITAERAREAKEAGLSTVSVSIDGLPATHDHLRAVAGSYDQAIEALHHLQRAGIPISVNTQICAKNKREIEPLFERLHPLGIHSWQVQLTVAMGRAADEPDLLLQPYQMLEVMPMVARLHRRATEVGVILWPASNLGYFGPYESILRADHPGQYGTGCGAGRDTLGLEANGDIKGCPSLPTTAYVGGNIRDHRLVDVWERAQSLRFTRRRGTDELWGFCSGCYYADTCKAGCTWTGHVLFGRRGNNPMCHHRALEQLRAGRRERLVPRAPAPNEPFDHATFELVEELWPAESLARAHAVVDSGEGWLDEP